MAPKELSLHSPDPNCSPDASSGGSMKMALSPCGKLCLMASAGSVRMVDLEQQAVAVNQSLLSLQAVKDLYWIDTAPLAVGMLCADRSFLIWSLQH
jgi:hypothetical protein